jgi:proteasome-associated ATPase
MPETPDGFEPARLFRHIRSSGPNALTRDRKLELMRELRARGGNHGDMLDESLLVEIERLREGLDTAHRQQRELRLVFEKLTAPPWHVGVFLGTGTAAGREPAAIVAANGSRRMVNFAHGVTADGLAVGDTVLLGAEQNIVVGKSPRSFLSSGETAVFDRCTSDGRLVVRARDEELVIDAADAVQRADLRAGDVVRWDRNLWLAFERVERSQGRHLFLEDTPPETFASIGGLDRQIDELQRAIRLHHLHAGTVRKYQLKRRAAVLLAGPPGTGKTMIARALANWLAALSRSGRSRFMNVKPGSLHSMWYAQSEANYRDAFRVARDAGEQDPDTPVLMFFDEVDAIGASRGESLMRVDDRVLTAFLTELDGLESRGNVLVVCATNRRDALDPALLRAGGRLGDIVLEVPRPNRRAALEIFGRHLPPTIPYATTGRAAADPSAREEIIASAVARVYGPNGVGELASLMFRDGKRRAVVPADLVSGAAIANIARRAIEQACMREVDTGESGVRLRDVIDAIDSEFESAAAVLTPANARRHIDALPQDVDVVRVERNASRRRPSYRFLSVA